MKKYIIKIFKNDDLVFQFITDEFKEALDIANEYVGKEFIVKIFKSDELSNN